MKRNYFPLQYRHEQTGGLWKPSLVNITIVRIPFPLVHPKDQNVGIYHRNFGALFQQYPTFPKMAFSLTEMLKFQVTEDSNN